MKLGKAEEILQHMDIILKFERRDLSSRLALWNYTINIKPQEGYEFLGPDDDLIWEGSIKIKCPRSAPMLRVVENDA